MSEHEIAVVVNGEQRRATVEARRLLVHWLREDLGLRGTNVGCDTSSCGACTVLVDGTSAKSCTLLAVQVDGGEVTTIEGLHAPGADAAVADDVDTWHPVQRAFRDHHAAQCGFCTPGMVLAAVSLIAEQPALDGDAVRQGLEGNLCRCTGYHNIVAAVLDAAGAIGSPEPDPGPDGGVR